MTIQEKIGFRKVINARGPATVLGASKVKDSIRQDIYDILGESVETWELQRRASEAIMKLTNAEAGCVVGCASAGMAIAAAASITGSDISKIKVLPDVTWNKKKIIIQKGQVTGAGDCPVYQVIKMTGAHYVEIGEALDCATYHLRDALDENTAAAFYIIGELFAPNLLPIDTFISICKEKNVPVIVDAAYLTDFKMLASKGVDLAIYSGQKWLGGCTSGIVAGRKDLVHACFLQELGIGRPMKVGKEGMVSIISSISNWLTEDKNEIRAYQKKLADNLGNMLKKFEGVSCKVENSLFSPSIRLEVIFDQSKTRIPAWIINDELGKMDPVIKVEDYYVNNGKIVIDFAYVSEGDEKVIGDSIIKLLQDSENYINKALNKGKLIPKTKQDRLFDMFSKWLDGDPRE
jgi:L-seryl-tRNA(Ser) seleniumtransferase